MTVKVESPWASGPGEILRHALDLLKQDNDTRRRLAMICIDNAVELMMKVYLGLPQRVTGLRVSRKEYQEFSESFPALLDALEKYATDKLDGINLGDIEWYHRLRNELYHQGNGLTVERDKVEVYAELAKMLFNNLFGFRLVEAEPNETELLGRFMEAWVALERTMLSKASIFQEKHSGRPVMPLDAARLLRDEGLLSSRELAEIDQHRTIRNRVVHGDANYKEVLRQEMINRLRNLTKELENRRIGDIPQPPWKGSHEERLDKVRAQYPKAYEKWTEDEDRLLKQKFEAGASIDDLAGLLKRQPSAINSRLVKLGLVQSV